MDRKSTHTIVADSPNLRERFGLLGNLISTNFGTQWHAEPLPGAQRPARMSWAACDGVGVSRAQMAPLRLRSSGITALGAREPRKYFLYTASALSRLSLDGRPPLTIQPGEILLLNNEAAMDWTMTSDYTCSNFVIEADIFRQAVPEAERILGRPFVLPFGINGVLLGMLDAAWEMAIAGQFERCGEKLVRSFLDTLSVALAVDPEPQAERVSALQLRRHQVKRYIDRNFGCSSLSIGAIARSLGLTPRYLQLAFAAEAQSPLDYLRHVRLSAAAARLRDPAHRREDITRIAFDCGFGSSAHFATEFRRQYGVSPREYRRGEREN